MAKPERIRNNILAHSGAMSIARNIYRDVRKFITTASPNVQFVFNGHSLGGSIATLMLLQLTEEFGAEFVRDRVSRVFTFGSPPVVTTDDDHKDVLSEYSLPQQLVFGFNQPLVSFDACILFHDMFSAQATHGILSFAVYYKGPVPAVIFASRFYLSAH